MFHMRKPLSWIIWNLLPLGIIGWLNGIWVAWLDYLPALATEVPIHTARLLIYRRLGATIGEHTSIHRSCEFYNIPGLKIAENSVINRHVVLDARSGLTIGRNVSISEYAIIYSLQHDLDDPNFRVVGGPVVIEDYAFIGARAIILPGIRVGFGAAVAAGAVVTKDVPCHTVVGGVPAKPIRQRAKSLEYTLDYRRAFY